MALPVVSTQIQLVHRPQGWPTANDFRSARVELPDLGPGQVRVANEYISVDPYMRGRMNDVKSYAPPYALGEVMTGGAVGHVTASTADSVGVGDVVVHQLGWRDVAQDDAAAFRVVPQIAGVPISAHLGVLGMTAFTAYVGLLKVAAMVPGDSVFVSGAAGAVGSMVGQIARLKGAGHVIGSAGSAEKVALLTDRYGFDAAFNYKDGAVTDQLAAAAPGGIDVYFDNVGGDHLEAALAVLNDGGRAALCGAISQYNSTAAPAGPRNLANMIGGGLTLTGFIVGKYPQHYPAFAAEMSAWLAAGEIVFDETIVDGIEHAVDAFGSLMHGGNTGKMLVRVGESASKA
ncbi:MAG: NADP-dependent oxidoreductase [Cellulomonas sp.]